MKKSTIAAAVGLALGGASMGANAAISSTTVLAFDNGNYGNFSSAAAAGSSYFSMVVDTLGTVLYTGVQQGTDGGIHIGAAQTTGTWNSNTSVCSPAGAACSHGGVPYDDPSSPYYGMGYTTDHGPIDMGWGFFGNTGLHFTAGAISVSQDNGLTKQLDFSGWRVTWNGIPAINMGGGQQVVTSKTGTTTYNNGSGLATLSCSNSSCSATSTWTLDYAAVVPQGDPSNFGGTPYTFHATGTMPGTTTPPIPVPAAAWLLGSGLLGLVGVARRRKQS